MMRKTTTHFKSVLLLVGILAMTSCKSTKVLSTDVGNLNLATKKIIDGHYANEPQFNTLRGRVKIDYSDGDKSQGVSVSLRMERDKTIWISAPAGLVKAYLTPNRVSFYNKLDKEYFDGDYAYFSDLLGTELDFEKVQNLLIGTAIWDMRKEKYTSETRDGLYVLKPKKAQQLFKLLMEVEATNFKITQVQLTQPDENRELSVAYAYQEVEQRVVPAKVDIIAKNEDSQNNIDLEFRNLEFNKALRFPYKVPRGYKEVILD